MRTFETVWTKLAENGAAFRKAFVSSQVKRLIPFQIHALRKNRGWSQEELAKRSGLTQGVISRAEDPDNGNLTFNTVIAIAGGFDVAFIGKFVPFSESNDYFVGISERSAGSVPSFSEESVGSVETLGKISEQMDVRSGGRELGSLDGRSGSQECLARFQWQQEPVGQGK
jgi:transcriptional regulator with XRE-family HTH domain